MKPSFLAMLALLACSQHSFGQTNNIQFQSTLEKTRTLAAEQQKPMAILITIPPVVSLVAQVGLTTASVVEKFNTRFINFQVAQTDTAVTSPLIKEFNIHKFPAWLFLDAKGGLLFTDVAILSNAEPLLDAADKAINEARQKSLVDYQQEYVAGDDSREFLRAFILRRERAGITDNAELIEKYVNRLTVAELDNYEQALFILKAGPFADGRAHKILRLNNALIDRIFKTEPLQERIAINNAISNNTMKNAIATKNVRRAIAAAQYTSQSWMPDYKEGIRHENLKMIQYYKAVNDTIHYLNTVSAYYDNYYMKISLDSIRKRDALDFEKAMGAAVQTSQVALNNGVVKRTVVVRKQTNSPSATQLNNEAWHVYEIGISDPKYLMSAILWSQRAIELEPKPEYYDTCAHLLYKIKFFNEAANMQKKAIEAALAEKRETKHLEDEYKKISQRTL